MIEDVIVDNCIPSDGNDDDDDDDDDDDVNEDNDVDEDDKKVCWKNRDITLECRGKGDTEGNNDDIDTG